MQSADALSHACTFRLYLNLGSPRHGATCSGASLQNAHGSALHALVRQRQNVDFRILFEMLENVKRKLLNANQRSARIEFRGVSIMLAAVEQRGVESEPVPKAFFGAEIRTPVAETTKDRRQIDLWPRAGLA
jgi:hypothetical protein